MCAQREEGEEEEEEGDVRGWIERVEYMGNEEGRLDDGNHALRIKSSEFG